MIVRLSNLLKFLFETEEGVTAIEYALIGGLISVFIIVALSLVGQEVGTTFDIWTGAVHNAVSSAGS
jgi:Flp pilus assembly pilin Flp